MNFEKIFEMLNELQKSALICLIIQLLPYEQRFIRQYINTYNIGREHSKFIVSIIY